MTGPERQTDTAVIERGKVVPRHVPMWHVLLHDDDEHTYEYVIEMLGRLFAMDVQTAYRHACEVDATGVTILATLPLEHAEHKQERIHGYGPDPRIRRCAGSMTSTIEPAE